VTKIGNFSPFNTIIDIHFWWCGVKGWNFVWNHSRFSCNEYSEWKGKKWFNNL